MGLLKPREVKQSDVSLEYLAFSPEDMFPIMTREVHRAIKAGICAMVNGNLSLSLEEGADGIQWVKVWLDTGKRDFPIYQEKLPNLTKEN